ncbi:hypothetical protein F441_13146 [Phytophthora nicotianae CJ01A1]|nr:hypothetical protein L916_12788 [Phytophthora nicotianae]ETO70221.1 hypothetical protein F444_13266 [Phytophthora nicotianae P1976]ETP11318.1 hypothetical protein F441_13146 [Phytophthora nicotianae CJ01A1]
MHLHILVGLTIVIYFVADISATEPTGSMSSVNDEVDFYNVSKTRVSDTRFLRIVVDGNEEERTGLSVPPSEKLKSWLKSSNITPEKLQKWLNKEKSPDIVFSRMQLTKAGDLLFYNSKFSTWLQYVDDLSKTSKEEVSAIKTLTARYGDSKLYGMIKSIKRFPEEKSLATRLEEEQMQHWVNLRKDPDEIFQLFNLAENRRYIFRHPEFTTWVKYVDSLKAKHPKEPVSMTQTLTKYFSDKYLLELVKEAEVRKGSKTVATKVEDDLLEFWLKDGKSPDDALVEVGLGMYRYFHLENPMFDTLAKYLRVYNSKYPDKKTTMIELLTKKFGDGDVSAILTEAKLVDATKNIASTLQSAQLEMWLSKGKSVDDVALLLRLYRRRDFTEKPLLSTWVSYMNTIATNNPHDVHAIFSSLESQYVGRPLLQILEAAKQYPSMENTALGLQTKTIRSIFASGETPAVAFSQLVLDQAGDGLLSNPLFKNWMEYVKDFNKKNPEKQESWFQPLRIAYQWRIENMIARAKQNPTTVNIANTVERAWRKQWVEWNYAPSAAFKFFQLNRAYEKTLLSPEFKVWVKYLNYFNRQHPDKKETIIDGMKANYNDINILLILNAAKKDPNTKKMVTYLQNELVNKWVVANEDPAVLRRRFSGTVENGEEMVQRYIKKREAMSATTS